MELRNILIEIVFIIHILIIVILVVLSVYAPIMIVVLVIILHRLQLYYMDGCIINKMERHLRGDDNFHFLSELSQKVTGMPLDRKGVKYMDYAIAIVVIIVSVAIFTYKKRSFTS